jgi:hypothetical protein
VRTDLLQVSIRSPNGVVERDFKREYDCWPSRSSVSIEDPFEISYDVAHPLRPSSDRYFRSELVSAVVGS